MAESLDDLPKGLPPTPTQTARSLVDALTARHVALRRPVFVALDGRSGAGKSTLATAVAESFTSQGITVTVIAGDDFYAGGSAELWDQRSLAEKAQRVIDWQRQHQLLGDHHRAEWEARWSAAEDHYFGMTMPPHCFDLVL